MLSLNIRPPDNIGEEEDNPYRVENTLVKDQNFARITIENQENRRFSIAVFDKNGENLWEESIPAEQLDFEKEQE